MQIRRAMLMQKQQENNLIDLSNMTLLYFGGGKFSDPKGALEKTATGIRTVTNKPHAQGIPIDFGTLTPGEYLFTAYIPEYWSGQANRFEFKYTEQYAVGGAGTAIKNYNIAQAGDFSQTITISETLHYFITYYVSIIGMVEISNLKLVKTA